MKYLARAVLLIASTLSPCVFQMHAQAVDPPSAPLPSALTTATKLFIGNAGDQENADCLRAYNSFYQDIQSLNRFQLVSGPAQADLILELHYEIDLGTFSVSDHTINSGRQFRVVILDPHTHVLLWSLTERINYAVFQKNRNKNLDQTVDQLAKDFDSLTAAQPVAPNNKSRVTH